MLVPPAGEPLAGDVVQNVKRLARSGLIIFVIGHQRATIVAAEHFRRQELPARKRRLARPGRADEDDEGEFWDVDIHSYRFSIPPQEYEA